MNGLSIVVAIIFLACAAWGCYKGFLKIAASFAVSLVSIILVVILAPHVSNMIMKTFSMEEKMQKKCIEWLVPEKEEVEGEGAALPEGVDSSRETQITLLENAKLPEMFRQLLLENNNKEIYKSLGVTTFSEYVGSYLAKLIANVIGFLLALLVVTVIIRLLIYALGIIEKIPVIGGLNRVAGGLVGIGTGLIVVWVLFVIITLLYDTKLGTTCFQHIAENKFLTELYDKNILMNFITKFRA